MFQIKINWIDNYFLNRRVLFKSLADSLADY